MSGPKGMSYEVVDPAELERRARVAAEARAQVRREATRSLVTTVSPAVRSALAAPPVLRRSASLAELAAFDAASDAYDQTVRDAVARERATAARAAFEAQLARLEVDLGSELFRRSSVRPARETAPQDPELVRRLDRALSVAATVADEDLMTTLGELAVRVRDAATPAATARHSLTEIEARVTRAAGRHRGRQALARRQRAVEAEFGDLTVGGSAEAAAEVLQRVREATDEPAVDRLVGELRGLRARATADADRSFAITQAAEVLRALGYHVDQDAPAHNGTSRMVATSGRWPRHGLRLVFRSDQPGIHSSAIALSATDARDDVAFEEASCTDIGRLRAELERRGVTTRMTHHVPPGQLAVRREYAAQDRTSTGTATAAKPRERSR